MTKQLKDLFASFTEMETSQQLEQIRKIRHHRSIERPAAAVKRVKKEKKQSEKRKTNLADLLKKLPPEQRAAIISKLQADLDEKKARDNAKPPSLTNELGTGSPDAEESGGSDGDDDGGSG